MVGVDLTADRVEQHRDGLRIALGGTLAHADDAGLDECAPALDDLQQPETINRIRLVLGFDATSIPRAEHITPTDAVWLAEGAIRTTAMGRDKTIAAVRDYIAAFLDANLQSMAADRLLTGPKGTAFGSIGVINNCPIVERLD